MSSKNDDGVDEGGVSKGDGKDLNPEEINLATPQGLTGSPADEVVQGGAVEDAEELIADSLRASREDEVDDEAEIDSMRATLSDDEVDIDEDGIEDEISEDDAEDSGRSSLASYERAIQKVNGVRSNGRENLRAQLLGKILLTLSDVGVQFLFDWSKEELAVSKHEGDFGDPLGCRVEMSSKDFDQILRGRLNPQVAMLSHKVQVSGNSAPAVYFFNLFGGR